MVTLGEFHAPSAMGRLSDLISAATLPSQGLSILLLSRCGCFSFEFVPLKVRLEFNTKYESCAPSTMSRSVGYAVVRDHKCSPKFKTQTNKRTCLLKG